MCLSFIELRCFFEVVDEAVLVLNNVDETAVDVYLPVGFAFASQIFGGICPWTFSRGLENQCLERFVITFFFL